MTSIRRQGLKIDDPLGPSPSGGATADGDAPAKPRARSGSSSTKKRPAARSKPIRGQARSATADEGVWREWSGLTGVGSFRLPHELLAELSDTARGLGLPVGLMATAAITQLLDQPADQIAALVDRADDARIHGRRTSRRPLSKTAKG